MTDIRKGVIGNAVGVTAGERLGEEVFVDAMRLEPDIITIVEADEIALNDGVRSAAGKKLLKDYQIFHRGLSLDKDGTLVAVRRDHECGRPRWKLCTPDFLQLKSGRIVHFDIRPRYSLTVPVKYEGSGRFSPTTGVHFPPARSKALLPTAYAAMRDLDPDQFMGDLNILLPAVRDNFPSKEAVGIELLHVVAKEKMKVTAARKVVLGDSDHPGVQYRFEG